MSNDIPFNKYPAPPTLSLGINFSFLAKTGYLVTKLKSNVVDGYLLCTFSSVSDGNLLVGPQRQMSPVLSW